MQENSEIYEINQHYLQTIPFCNTIIGIYVDSFLKNARELSIRTRNITNYREK